MKLGVFTTLLSNLSLEKALQYFQSLGIEMVEIGCGGYPGNAHADPETLLNDPAKLAEFKALIAKYGMEISALSCHGNPVHPNKEIAAAFDKTIRDTILLAEALGLHQINTSPAARATARARNIPTGWSAPGRTISARSSTGSGIRC